MVFACTNIDGRANANGKRIDQAFHHCAHVVALRARVLVGQGLQLSVVQLQVSYRRNWGGGE